MGYLKALELIRACPNEKQARQELERYKKHKPEGFLGGRVIPPGRRNPNWRVQLIFRFPEDDSPIPYGMRRIVVPQIFLEELE
jgi:hypothetical protein